MSVETSEAIASGLKWVLGETNPVLARKPQHTRICKGDLVAQDDFEAVAARTFSGSPEQFCERFLGVATEDAWEHCTQVRVATSGFFTGRFEPPHEVELGELVGPTWSGEKSQRNLLAIQEDPQVAYGKIAKRSAGPESFALVRIFSAILDTGLCGCSRR